MHERSRLRCEDPRGELEKAGTSIETGTTEAPGVCPTFPALAFPRSADEKTEKGTQFP